MNTLKSEFIQLLIESDCLSFGDFTLKSGRKSPFFFNTGKIQTGQQINRLGEFFARKIVEESLDFDVLFGSPYKGIPIVIATAIALERDYGKSSLYCFNRKEAKSHGESGFFIGSPIKAEDSVLIVDDILTLGTALKETLQIIPDHKSHMALIAIDRLEKKEENCSASLSLLQDENLEVHSLVDLDDIIEYLKEKAELSHLQIELFEQYRSTYCINRDRR